MCTMEYAPVCGQRGGRVQTFANACQARAAFLFDHQPRPVPPPAPDSIASAAATWRGQAREMCTLEYARSAASVGRVSRPSPMPARRAPPASRSSSRGRVPPTARRITVRPPRPRTATGAARRHLHTRISAGLRPARLADANLPERLRSEQQRFPHRGSRANAAGEAATLTGGLRLRGSRRVCRLDQVQQADLKARDAHWAEMCDAADMTSSGAGTPNMWRPSSATSVKHHLTTPSRSSRNSPTNWPSPVAIMRLIVVGKFT